MSTYRTRTRAERRRDETAGWLLIVLGAIGLLVQAARGDAAPADPPAVGDTAQVVEVAR